MSPSNKLCSNLQQCCTTSVAPFRSLSEVPKGLRPIRTTSGRVTGVTREDDNQLKGFAARLRWARQQCLRQSGKQQAAHPTPARVGCLSLPVLYTISLLSTCVIHLLHVCIAALVSWQCQHSFSFLPTCSIYLQHVCLVLYLLVVTHHIACC